MKKIGFLIVWMCLVTYSFAQEVVKQSEIHKSASDFKFFSLSGASGPASVYDAGGVFIVKHAGQVICVDNELTKKWSVAAEFNKGFNPLVSHQAANASTFYDIAVWGHPNKPAKLSIAAYNMENGKVSNFTISFNPDDPANITGFFARNDGLYFLKLDYNSKTKKAEQVLGKVDASGKLSEVKLPLSFTAEEMEDFKIFTLEDKMYTHQYIGSYKDKNILMKGYPAKNASTKALEIPLTFGTLDANNKYTVLKNTVLQPNKGKNYTPPVAKLDTVNQILYAAGYLIGGTGFTGIYYYSYNLATGKDVLRTMTFEELNTSLKPADKFDENIMFAETGLAEGMSRYYEIGVEPDPYNKLVLIYLVRRNDLFLKDGYRYVYLNEEGTVVEATKIITKKGELPKKVTMYSTGERKYKTGIDYSESNYPVDKNKFMDFLLNREGHMLLVRVMETQSKILAYKLKIK